MFECLYKLVYNVHVPCVDVWFIHSVKHFTRLKYVGEFLLTSPKQSEMNILCSLSGAHLMNDVSRMIPSKLSSMHRTVVMVSFVYGLVFHNLYSSKVWTIGL